MSEMRLLTPTGHIVSVDVDRIFTDGKTGPTILMAGERFLYGDSTPVTDPAHVAHLPEPYRTQALAFIERAHPPGVG